MSMIMLDRDGVLNQDRVDYVKTPEEMILITGAARAVARLNRAGVTTVVVTNQSGVGRGIFDEDMLAQIHTKLREELARENAHLDYILFCTDHPDCPTRRRKPAPGMLQEALEHFSAASAATPMVGDSLRDLEAAAALGCPRILVRTGHGEKTLKVGLPESVQPVAIYDDLAAVVDALLEGTL
ncbi:MAG: D-glycero-beta-D-manno-heptose 1,7-bisphosphate 7-phosphatase [Alphaproteobacteria bacterium]|jgi:D-glycero-D-manno-heptose 1,7-bisphosphate phosphatase|nr:D-glycero-beta-D-manno-heptose 1,7-bisphosphate 7-phosphatase [Alphaproteobacteria bacterium]MDP7190650.1 D-glycero-beta-D-manno-heptose 1,7-bisphosphate 7-phosphatase [Alphaproteobacteria bacterium]